VTQVLDTSFLLPVKIVEHAHHAEALRLMSAYLFMDRLQDPRDHELDEICFDGRAQALWDV
jgi:hypothetical protein